MARRKDGATTEKRTPVKYRPIPRKNAGRVTEPWSIMERLLADEPAFQDIRHCRVRLLWQKDWKVDADGIATGAMVCRASELDRLLVEETAGTKETPDIFIKLGEKNWTVYDEKTKERLLYHELLHIHRALDGKGEQKKDALGRQLWRIGRHPIATFPQELAKYGAEAVFGSNQAVLDAMRDADQPLLKDAGKGGVDKGVTG